MTTRSVRGAVTLAAALALAACNPTYYSPNTQKVPLLTGRGDLTGTLALGGGRVEAHGAYALTNSVGVQANVGKYAPDDLDNGDGGSGDFVEGGIGYFGPLGQRLRWEVFGLIAAGSFENHRPSSIAGNPGTTGDISASLLRLAVQPAVGLRSRYFEVAASTKLSRIVYSDVDGSFRFQNQDQVQRLRENDSYVVVEPALTVRGGLPRVKLQIQLERSFNLTESDFLQDDGMLTLGLILRK
jgi:hypothetical protein